MDAAIRLVAFGALSSSAATQELPAVIPGTPEVAIEAQFDRWIGAFEACDAGALSKLFTPDGIYAANTGEVMIGREAIRNGVQAWMAGPLNQACQNAELALDVERRPLRTDVVGGSAYSLTRFIIRVQPMACSIDAGHILGVWRRQPTGEWLLEAVTGNKDPMPRADACRS